jgi:predicted DNA-binding transcriptional regulator YafY
VPLGTLSAAAHAHQRIRLRYESPASGITTREFDPYGLSYQGGRWYAVGMCHLRRDMRTFRLDRIIEAARLDTFFERPDGFDVLDFIARSFAAIPRAHAVEVLLHTDLPTAQAQSVGRYGFLEPCEGGVMLRTRTDSLEWYAGLLAGLPFDFEIRRPAEMQEAMRRIAARVLRSAVNLHTLRRSWRTTEFPTGSGNHPIECRCRDPSELCSIGGLDRCDLRRTNH